VKGQQNVYEEEKKIKEKGKESRTSATDLRHDGVWQFKLAEGHQHKKSKKRKK